LTLTLSAAAWGQLNQNCTVSVLNRTVQVNPDGSWVLPNVPANFGQVKARATCVQNGVTTFGESAFFTVPANAAANLPAITIGVTTPTPVSLSITSPTASFAASGQTSQLSVIATYPDGSTKDVTASSAGTNYTISNPATATITPDGLVTSVASGTVVIQASNDGAAGITTLQVVVGGATVGGLSLSWILANGLDPNDPNLALEDPDRDGLTNLQEFQLGTNPNNPDTDGDGLTDGDEVNKYHTNPLLPDTDGDLIPDGVEIQTGTNPLDPKSYDLKKATASSVVAPSSFVLSVNSLSPTASQQLDWKVKLIDGKTTLDLTADPRTTYNSSDLTICGFGGQAGLIFAGNSGTCVITISQNTLSATVSGTVQSFTPTALSFVSIPGFANGVAVSGQYAFVASGAAGLQVVDVSSDRMSPTIVTSLSLPGNANDITIAGHIAYVAAGSEGLQAVDITSPTAPVLVGSLSTGGTALDINVRGTTAYVANETSLFLANVANPASISAISTLPLSGLIQGVDVDTQRNLAVVAAGAAGVYVVDLSNPSSPIVLGATSTGDAHDVAIRGNYAFVADYDNSTTSVDITTPSTPTVLSHIADPNLGGFLNDIVLSSTFALAADVKFVNGIPITGISDPTNLQAVSILNFPQRDDNGMGIAIDNSYVYLTTVHSAILKFGSTEDSRLYIGQYQQIVDNGGIPPSVQITSPTRGPLIQGSTIMITANAKIGRAHV